MDFSVYLGIDRPPLRAVLCLCMENLCLIRCMGNLICSLKIKETEFVVSTPHSNCQFLLLGLFAKATKISILSNDQTCHLCNVGSIQFNSIFDILHS